MKSPDENRSVEGETVSPADPYQVLRNRNFLYYIVGRFIASFGHQMLTLAVGWQIYERTGSALALGLVGLTQMIPMIACTLPAGHFADNHDRKRIILLMMLVACGCSVGLALTSHFDGPTPLIYGCLLVTGTARTFLWPASSAFMPQLVSREQFSRAVTWNTGTFHLSSVLGPAAGGAIIAGFHSATPVYVINTLAVLISWVLMALIQAHPVSLKKEPMTLGSLVAGFRFVFASSIILGIISLDLFAVLFGGATALLPVYAKDILHAGPSGLGFLQSALPIGSLACSAALAHLPTIQKAGRALLWSVTLFGLATIVFGISRNFYLSFAMLFVCGVSDNVSVVIRHTLVQLLTPDEKRGRVSAVNSLFIGTSNELGGFESGAVAQWLGPVFSVVSGGICTLLVVIGVACIWPSIRRYGRLDSTG